MDYRTKIRLITWNVRGLNERDKRLAVRQIFFLEKPDIICLQETKLSSISDQMAKEICGRRLGGRVSLDAMQTRGGVLISWRESRYRYIHHEVLTYCVSVRLEDTMTGTEIVCTAVYGPSRSAQRDHFFNELHQAKPIDDCPWIVCGDFNVTLQSQDRNLPNSDWRGPLEFHNLLIELELSNLPMRGRNYTWSNARETPSMAKLDRFLISATWGLLFPNSVQQTLPNSSSDHCPIRYEATTNFKSSRRENVETESKSKMGARGRQEYQILSCIRFGQEKKQFHWSNSA